MDFVVGDVVRQGFGFANPNHAAAAICAAFPFCWGWGGAHTSSDRLRGALRSGYQEIRIIRKSSSGRAAPFAAVCDGKPCFIG